MLRYEVGFSVLKFDGKSRTCKNAIFFDDFNSLIAWGINPCDYEYLSDTISKINKLISKEIHEYEWGGGERTWFLSKSDTTTVIDNFAWQDNIVVPTSEILEIILGRKQIMDKWKEDDVRDILSISFDKIKQKPIAYINNQQDFSYKVHDMNSGIVIFMILLEEDFNLTPFEFCEQIKFK